MPVRTDRLWAVTGIVSGPAVTVLTCPTDQTIIVKDFTLQNVGGSSTGISLTLRTSTATVNVFRGTIASGDTTVERERFVVLTPGDSLEVAGLAAGASVRSAGFGSRLAGVAD